MLDPKRPLASPIPDDVYTIWISNTVWSYLPIIAQYEYVLDRTLISNYGQLVPILPKLVEIQNSMLSKAVVGSYQGNKDDMFRALLDPIVFAIQDALGIGRLPVYMSTAWDDATKAHELIYAVLHPELSDLNGGRYKNLKEVGTSGNKRRVKQQLINGSYTQYWAVHSLNFTQTKILGMSGMDRSDVDTGLYSYYIWFTQ